ncbi:hypothetical protein [Telluribacter sp.]|jgi:hypothetical protein|uniref:hypothetical protein n=1 Tax=Telluribacter sp. TaxID=1978767 RepID=UPI002E0E8F93|nr:hypothetical protein [Telluribacter sp.]
MPKLDRSDFKYNAKVFEKTCLWCGTTYYASRSTAKYCSSTCRGYANQASKIEEAVPWDETERTVDALLSQLAYLKGQLSHYIKENERLQQELGLLRKNGKATDQK